MSTRIPYVRTAFIAVLMAAATLVPGARAQGSRTVAQANVPFAFTYGTRVLPAGKYVFALTSDQILSVRGKKSAALGLVMRSEDNRDRETGKLVFRHTGDHYALREVWSPRLAEHLVCPKTKEPKHREMVQIAPTDTNVELALVDFPR